MQTAGPARTQQLTKPAITCKRRNLRDGDAGIAQTIKIMQKLLAGNEGAANPEIRRKALEIIAPVANGDKTAERNALFQWVKDNIKFRGEYQETLQTPLVTMQLQAGDCDDHATLLSALLQSVGHVTLFKTVAIGGRDFSHVYIIALDRRARRWVPLDTTVARSTPGWEAPGATRSKVWQSAMAAGLGDAEDILKAFDPLIQASAIRLAYGSNAGYQPFTQNFNRTPVIQANGPGGASASAMSPILWWVGGLFGAAILFKAVSR